MHDCCGPTQWIRFLHICLGVAFLAGSKEGAIAELGHGAPRERSGDACVMHLWASSGLWKPCRSASTMRYSATRWLTLSVVFSLIAYPGPGLASDADQPDIGPPSVPGSLPLKVRLIRWGARPLTAVSREPLVRELSSAGGLSGTLEQVSDADLARAGITMSGSRGWLLWMSGRWRWPMTTTSIQMSPRSCF